MKTPLTIGRLVEDFFLSRGGARRVPSEETELQEALRSQMSSGDTGTIFRWEDPDRERRDSTTLTATGGTDLQYGGSTIANAVPEIGRGLRAAMVLAGLGARILTGLKVNTGLPYGTTKISGEWKAEGDPASEQGDEFGKLDLQPHRVTAAVPVPRELLDIGNPVFNAWLTSELLAALAVEIERAAIAGSGIGAEPLGLLNNTAIGGVGGGPSGAAPTYGNLVDLEAAVKISAGGRFGFLVSRLVR